MYKYLAIVDNSHFTRFTYIKIFVAEMFEAFFTVCIKKFECIWRTSFQLYKRTWRENASQRVSNFQTQQLKTDQYQHCTTGITLSIIKS